MNSEDLAIISRAVAVSIRERVKPFEDQVLSLVAEIEKRVAEFPVPKDGERGPAGEQGEPGKPGQNGSSVLVEDVLPQLRSAVDQFLAAIKSPQDGKDGANGRDGASVTLDDVRPLIELELSRWAVEFERRAQDVLQRAIDRIPAPKDGKDGKDGAPGQNGRDALSVEDFQLGLDDQERTLTVALVCGDKRIGRQVRLSHPIHRGVYQPASNYLKGDCVTFGGSSFSATRDTDSKPETDDSWRLIVKRGRDGRDGQKGERGEPGRNARHIQPGGVVP